MLCAFVILPAAYRPCKNGSTAPAQTAYQARIHPSELVADKIRAADEIDAQALHDDQQFRKDKPQNAVHTGGEIFLAQRKITGKLSAV